MATAILLSVVLCVALSAAADSRSGMLETESNCWKKHGSRFFLFVNTEMKWTDAERYCQAYNANLASIHSPAEYAFIQELVKSQTGTHSEAWIGGTDAVEALQWFWSDGSSFSYQYWARGEPSNGGGFENCIEINYSDDHLWNDRSCDNMFRFICGTRPG